MKIVIPGGSGQIGRLLAREFTAQQHEVVILCRHGVPPDGAPTTRVVTWDGRTLGPWARELDGADLVINLAGRTVNCRYTPENLKQMLDSRVDSTRAVGQAIAAARQPPPVWLQMSTATIYSHRFDHPNDEISGVIGGGEPDAPAYWKTSIDIATAWEAELNAAPTPATRRVALRTAMVMTPDRGGVFDVLTGLARKGLGGAIAGGRQYVSWIHGRDFFRAIEFLVAQPALAGAVNLAAPGPLPQREFMADLRRALGVRLGLPAAAWMVKLGAVFLRTDAELVLKSRRVIPTRLTQTGFQFDFPAWPAAAADLTTRQRNRTV